MQNTAFQEAKLLWHQFLNHLPNSNGDLSSFWMTYILVDMAEHILLALIRDAREGKWPLHLAAIRESIAWCFAYGKVNYDRYLPAYYATMMQIQQTKPKVHEALMKGCFSIQQSESNPLRRIPFSRPWLHSIKILKQLMEQQVLP